MRWSGIYVLIFALVIAGVGCKREQKKEQSGTVAPLHEAAGAGDLIRVRSLLSNGEAVDARDEEGATALVRTARS